MPDLTPEPTEIPPAARLGKVSKSPSSLVAPMEVTIPSFSGDLVYTITRWHSRGISIPAIGDDALVIEDEAGDPWVAAWWPQTGDASGIGEEALVGPTGATGAPGPTGLTGDPGAAGRDAGIKYAYSNSTAATDPGVGVLKFDSTTFASVTKLRISETDGDTNAIFAALATWDDSTSTIKGRLEIHKAGAPTPIAIFQITGAMTDNGTWDEFNVLPVAGALPTDGDEVRISFARTGDKGDQGIQGIQGTAGAAGAGSQNYPCQGRLTLATGDPAPNTDQTAKSTLFFTPYQGNAISLYTGSAWVDFTFTERSLALSGLTAGKNYDVFLFNNAGTLTLELSAAWTNDSTRADAIVLQNGVYVKSAATTRRYLGTIRATAATTTEDSAAKRFVWNAYNRRSRHLAVTDATANWTYAVASWRQARGSAANQVEDVRGLSQDEIEIDLDAMVFPNTQGCAVSIGVDSTTAPHADATVAGSLVGAERHMQHAMLRTVPAAGYHKYTWLELAIFAQNNTFYGTNGSPVWVRSGMRGTTLA